jgi:hypothetical protein
MRGDLCCSVLLLVSPEAFALVQVRKFGAEQIHEDKLSTDALMRIGGRSKHKRLSLFCFFHAVFELRFF